MMKALLLGLALLALAGCTSSNSGSATGPAADAGPPHVSCIVTGRSGDPSSCSLFGSCNPGYYAVDCAQSSCTCETKDDGGFVKGKTVPFDPLYCADGDAGTLTDRLTYRIEDAFTAANTACGWGLK